ncbi:MAG: amidohydrolase family protein [Acidimicrobiales bacterium]
MTRTVLTGGIVLDGRGGAPTSADVAIEGDRIVAIGPDLAPGDGADNLVDCAGAFIVPGVIDCHVHFMSDGDFDPLINLNTPFSTNFYLAAQRMARTLDIGVTTVREAGGADLGVKEAQERGLIEGPRMQISISILSQTGGHVDQWHVCGGHMPDMLSAHPGRPHGVVDGPEEMRRKVRELVRAGADVIKVCTSGGVISPRDDPRHAHFRDDELTVAVTEARAAGLWVMAHAQANDGIKAAIRTGIRSIEHGIYLDDEAIEMMLERGTYLVPTLIAPRGVLEAADRGITLPPVYIEKAKMVIETHQQSVAKAIGAGVKVAFGTDTGVTPHGDNLTEFAELVRCGMTPVQAWAAAGPVAAELMGLDDEIGTVEVGKVADLAVFDGDHADLDDLAGRVRSVFQSGRQVRGREESTQS